MSANPPPGTNWAPSPGASGAPDGTVYVAVVLGGAALFSVVGLLRWCCYRTRTRFVGVPGARPPPGSVSQLTHISVDPGRTAPDRDAVSVANPDGSITLAVALDTLDEPKKEDPAIVKA